MVLYQKGGKGGQNLSNVGVYNTYYQATKNKEKHHFITVKNPYGGGYVNLTENDYIKHIKNKRKKRK